LVKVGITDILLVAGGQRAGEFFRLFGDGRDIGQKLTLFI
jgi:dTDP-glucose pyrophosphorylase